MNCTAHESCYGSQIYASKAKNVDIMCYESGLNATSDPYYDDYYWYYSYWNFSSDSPCYDLNIYASMVTNELKLTCGGSYACYGTNLYAQNAHHVVIDGDNSEYVLQDANIYAMNASQLELMCIGGKRNFGCAYANIYLPLNPSQTLINCFGFGCDDLNLYAKNGVSDVLATKTHIEVNACGVCSIEKRNEKRCLNAWYLYCDSFDEYDADTKCTPTQHNDYSEECGCDTWMAVADSNQALHVMNNRSHIVCDALSEWQRPTHKPHEHHHGDEVIIVTRHPSNASGNTDSSFHDTYHHRIMMIVIASVVVVVLCLIGNVAYCWYKRRMTEKIASEILQHIDDQNQVVSIDDNINYNMSVVTNTVTPAKPAKPQRKYVKFQDGDNDDRNQPMATAGITTWSMPE
eukprot:279620_1